MRRHCGREILSPQPVSFAQFIRPKRLVIVGGVAGGASAAARARRLCEQCEITVFERGPHASFANCGLPYFVGGEIVEQADLLVQTSESLRARFNFDVRANTEVMGIDRTAQVPTPSALIGDETHPAQPAHRPSSRD